MNPVIKLFELVRVRQWVKNFFVLTPLFFARKLGSTDAIITALLAFMAFNFISSGIYIINDLCDIEADRKHPRKKNRPIPSGAISIPAAIVVLVIFFLAAAGTSIILNYQFIICISAYFVINLFYSFWGKHIVIFDVVSIALGFVLRVIAGAAAISVLASNWIMMATFFLSLFLGFGKRRNEFLSLENNKGAHRKVLDHYDEKLLNHLIFISCGISIMSYAMYTLTSLPHFNNGDKLIFTVPIVTFILFRYVFIIWKKEEGDPTEIILHDKSLVIAGVVLGLIVVGLIYGPTFV